MQLNKHQKRSYQIIIVALLAIILILIIILIYSHYTQWLDIHFQKNLQ